MVRKSETAGLFSGRSLKWSVGVLFCVAIVAIIVFITGQRRRPPSVPPSAVFADGGKGWAYWIDCKQAVHPEPQNRFCTIYTPAGDIMLEGSFRDVGQRRNSSIYYDGRFIHWYGGVELEAVKIDCELGGRRTETGYIPDCSRANKP